MKPGRGDESRFCDQCRIHVRDLSSMTRREARKLLSSPRTEGLCVRYLYDRSGEVVFADSLVRAKRVAVSALAVALPMTLTACMGAMPARRPAAPPPPAAAATAPAATASAHGAPMSPPPAPLAK